MTTTASPRRSIARAALVVSLGSVLSRLVGIAREQTIAGLFGRNSSTDAFTAAGRVPTQVYDLLVGGLISAALVPVLSAEAERDEEEYWRSVSVLYFLGVVLFAVTAVLLAIGAPAILTLVSPRFDAATLDLAENLLQIMAPSILFLGLSGISMAVLQSRRQFVAPAFGAAVFNLAMVFSALLLRGLGVRSLAIGMVAGALCQLVLQLIAIGPKRIRFSVDFRSKVLRRILRLAGPVLFSAFVATIGVAIDTNFASGLPGGDLSAMRYATTLMQFALGLVSFAIGTAYLPELSRSAGIDLAKFRSTLGEAFRAILALIVLVTIGLLALREPLVRLVFEHGAFNASDTARTALAFVAYSPGIPAAAFDQMLIYAFYARQDTFRPAAVGVASIIVYVVAALALLPSFGMTGLAFANSCQWISHALIMLFLLLQSISGVKIGAAAAAVLRTLLAALAAGALWWLAAPFLMELSNPVGLAPGLGIAGVVGLFVYVGALHVLKAPEARVVTVRASRLLNRLK